MAERPQGLSTGDLQVHVEPAGRHHLGLGGTESRPGLPHLKNQSRRKPRQSGSMTQEDMMDKSAQAGQQAEGTSCEPGSPPLICHVGQPCPHGGSKHRTRRDGGLKAAACQAVRTPRDTHRLPRRSIGWAISWVPALSWGVLRAQGARNGTPTTLVPFSYSLL